MAIDIACPGCQAHYEVEDTDAGGTAECPECGNDIPIPFPPAKKPAVTKPGKAPPGKTSGKKSVNHHAGHSLMNLLWFFLGGGLLAGIGWMLTGLIMIITIIGIPWARAAFMFAEFSFHPFGRAAVSRASVTGKKDIGTGCLGLVGNILWFFPCGLPLAIGHLCAAVLCFITIIGIPFGLQHIKFACAALAPIGKTIVVI